MSEAETSHEVYRFTCQARSKLEDHLDLRLEGLGRLSGTEVFSHELLIPPSKQSALGHALQLTLVPGCLKQPGDPLRWDRGGVWSLSRAADKEQAWSCGGRVWQSVTSSASDPTWLRSTTLYAALFTAQYLQEHSLLSPAAQIGTQLQPCSHCSSNSSAVPVQPCLAQLATQPAWLARHAVGCQVLCTRAAL